MKVTVTTTYDLDIERKDGCEIMINPEPFVRQMQQVLESKTIEAIKIKRLLELLIKPEDRYLQELSAFFFPALDERHFSQARAHKTSITVE